MDLFSGTWPVSTPESTSFLEPYGVAVFRSFKSCIQTQASTTLARSVIDDTVVHKAWR